MSSGATRAESETRWSMVNVDKAGWALNISPVMRLTASGRAALERYVDPTELAAAATAEYQRWDALRKQAAVDSGDALPGGVRLVGAGEQAVVRTAETGSSRRDFATEEQPSQRVAAPGRPRAYRVFTRPLSSNPTSGRARSSRN